MNYAADDLVLNQSTGLYTNIKTGATPAFIHFNGLKDDMHAFEKTLWFHHTQKPFVLPIDAGFYAIDGQFTRFWDVCPSRKYFLQPLACLFWHLECDAPLQ